MYVERRPLDANTPSGWAGTLRRSGSSAIKFRFDPCWSLIQRNLNGPILDAGCGRGDWVAFLASQGYETVGLDYSHDMISDNQKNFPECNFVQGRIQDIPFPDNEFGGVISWGVIEHDPDGPLSALSEMYRVLKKGGRALVTVPIDSEAQRLSSNIQFPDGNEFFQYFFSEDELVGLMGSAKFSVISCGAASRPHPALVFPRMYLRASPYLKRVLQVLSLGAGTRYANMIYCIGQK